MNDDLSGTLIGGRYRLSDVVGHGGMGVVYRAFDERLSDRPCAVKLLLGNSMDPEEAERFEREVRIIARLRSQHVVQVLDTGITDDGRRYIVMELLEGAPLSGLLKHGGPLDAPRAVRIIRGVLAGLSEAHEHGVVHRDLKPANVWITRARTGEETAKVLDFGIAKDSREGEDLTAASMVIGTPKYMAPEQFKKQPADARTDLYACGLLLYQMLAGDAPFTARTPVPATLAEMPDDFKVGWLHLNQAPAPLPVAQDLWAVLARLLAKKPDARYASAEQVLEALVPSGGTAMFDALPAVADSQSPSGVSSTTGFPVMGESLVQLGTHRRRPPGGGKGKWIALAAALLLSLGGAAVWALSSGGSADDRAAATGTAPDVCTAVIRSVPPGAVVSVGPDIKGATPVTFERPCEEKWMVKLEKKGFKDYSELLSRRIRKQIVQIKLVPEPKPAPRAVAAPTPAPAPPPEAAPAPKPEPVAAPKKRAPAERKPAPRRAEPRPARKAPAPAPAPDPPKKKSPLYF
jgi:serine/threonine protein kinase